MLAGRRRKTEEWQGGRRAQKFAHHHPWGRRQKATMDESFLKDLETAAHFIMVKIGNINNYVFKVGNFHHQNCIFPRRIIKMDYKENETKEKLPNKSS